MARSNVNHSINHLSLRLFLGSIFLFAFNVGHCGVQPDESIIANLKHINVSAIDSQLALMPYDTWLQNTLGSDASINWEVDDCGEGSSSEGVWPLCVIAIAELSEHRKVTISIWVGNSEKGVFGKPSVAMIYVEGVGPSRSFRTLHQLPDYLEEMKSERYSAMQFSDKPLDENSAINFAKNIAVRTLIPSQPDQTLLHWMETIAGQNAAVRWKLDGCDQVAISMQLSGNRDYRACVYAQFESGKESVLVSIEVGAYRRGLASMPKVALVQVYNKRRANFGITKPTLGELPGKLADMRRGESQ